MMTARNGHQLKFGLVKGKKGDVVTLSASSTKLFRGTKLIAEDSENNNGTLILQMTVGAVPIFPARKLSWWMRLLVWLHLRRRSAAQFTGIPTYCFGKNSLGNGLTLPVCDPNKPILIDVAFLADCEWSGWLFGETLS